MRAGSKSEHAHFFRNVYQGHPHRDGIVCIDRPVILVLVPGCGSAPWLLEQCLIVVDPDILYTHQVRRDLSKSFGKRKFLYRIVHLPQVHDLQKRFSIGITLFQFSFLGIELFGSDPDDLPVSSNFMVRKDPANQRMAIITKSFNGSLVNRNRRCKRGRGEGTGLHRSKVGDNQYSASRYSVGWYSVFGG